MSNHLYIGCVKFAGNVYKGQHDPIIQEDQFKRVQELLERHKGNNAHKAKTSLLSGLLKCVKCGESFLSYSTGISKKNKVHYYYYICRARRFPSEFPKKCFNKNWNREKLESIVISEIKNITFMKSKAAQKKKKAIDYEKLIKDIDKKMERLLEIFTSDTNISRDLLEKQMLKLNKEKEMHIKKQLSSSTEEQVITESMLNDIEFHFDELDFKKKQAIVHTLINEIHIDDDNVIIDWRF